MTKYLTALIPLLAAFAVRAQDGSELPISPSVSVVYVWIFGLLFVAMIVGFFVYLWWKERKSGDSEER